MSKKSDELLKPKSEKLFIFIKGFKKLCGFTVTTQQMEPLPDMPRISNTDEERQLSEWRALLYCLNWLQSQTDKNTKEVFIITNLENIKDEIDGEKQGKDTKYLCDKAKKLINEVESQKRIIVSVYWVSKNAEQKFKKQIENGEIPSWLDNEAYKNQLNNLYSDLNSARRKNRP